MDIYKKLNNAINKTNNEKTKEELRGLIDYLKKYVDGEPELEDLNRKGQLHFMEEMLWMKRLQRKFIWRRGDLRIIL